jgi:hypothetical protein
MSQIVEIVSEPSPTKNLGEFSDTQALHAHFCPNFQPIYHLAIPLYTTFVMASLARCRNSTRAGICNCVCGAGRLVAVSRARGRCTGRALVLQRQSTPQGSC